MSQLAQFFIDVAPDGTANILVNGEDVSSRVTGFSVQARPGQPPVLVLQHVAASGPITGEGIVQVSSSGDTSREEMLTFLDHIDPDQLEAEVLKAQDWGTSTMEAVLEVLKGWLNGRTS